jgi:hypothetical protein
MRTEDEDRSEMTEMADNLFIRKHPDFATMVLSPPLNTRKQPIEGLANRTS